MLVVKANTDGNKLPYGLRFGRLARQTHYADMRERSVEQVGSEQVGKQMPALLVLSLNSRVLGEFPLDREWITVGRDPDNDIQIDAVAINAHHCAVITVLDDCFVEELGKTNKTFVNGKLVKKKILSDGDQIILGEHMLTYSSGEDFDAGEFDEVPVNVHRAANSDPAPDHKHLSGDRVSEDSTAITADVVSQVETPGRKAHQVLGKLRVLGGAAAGKELELRKASSTLGRPGIQVAVITRRAEGYFIAHSEGRRPVVNGDEISLQEHPLQNHDVIELANVSMEFFLTKSDT